MRRRDFTAKNNAPLVFNALVQLNAFHAMATESFQKVHERPSPLRLWNGMTLPPVPVRLRVLHHSVSVPCKDRTRVLVSSGHGSDALPQSYTHIKLGSSDLQDMVQFRRSPSELYSHHNTGQNVAVTKEQALSVVFVRRNKTNSVHAAVGFQCS